MVRTAAFVFILFSAINAFGQVENNLVDISGGYALSRSSGRNVNGWYGDIGIRAYKSLYAVGGVATGYYSETRTLNNTPLQVSATNYSIGGGPRLFLTRRHSVISPFADVFFSYLHGSANVLDTSNNLLGSLTVTGLGIDIGGGADFRLGEAFSVRVRPTLGISKVDGETNNGFGLLAGVVLHFGE